MGWRHKTRGVYLGTGALQKWGLGAHCSAQKSRSGWALPFHQPGFPKGTRESLESQDSCKKNLHGKAIFLFFLVCKNPSDIVCCAWRSQRNGVNSATSVPDGKTLRLGAMAGSWDGPSMGMFPPVSTPQPRISTSVGARPLADPTWWLCRPHLPGSRREFSLLPTLYFAAMVPNPCSGSCPEEP